MADAAADPLVVEVDGVRAVVSPVGAELIGFSVHGVPYLEPDGADVRVRSLATDGRDLGAGTTWTVVSHDAATVALTTTVDGPAGDGPLSVTTAYSVGAFGLGVIHAVTNHGEHAAPVGVVARLRPRAGAAPVPAGRLSLNTAHRLTGDGAAAALTGPLEGIDDDGVAVADLARDAVFGGAVPPAGKTHVTHILSAADGDALRIWGDPEFGWVHVERGGAAPALTVAPSTFVPGLPQPPAAPATGALTVAAGATRSVTWGLQPAGCRPSVTPDPPAQEAPMTETAPDTGPAAPAAPAAPPRTAVVGGRTVHCTSEEDAASMGAEVFDQGSYDVAAALLSPGGTVLDVGAHFGFVPLRLTDLVGPLRVVACEPAPPTYACLEANLRDHLEGAVARNVAVGAAPGSAELTYYLDPGMSALSTLDADEADVAHNIDTVMANVGVDDAAARRQAVSATMNHAATFEVPVVTVTDLVAEHGLERVDLLKVDVERVELEVLQGVSDDLWPRIGAVVMEVHDVDGRLDLVTGMLTGRGFDVDRPLQEGVLRGTSVHQLIARRP